MKHVKEKLLGNFHLIFHYSYFCLFIDSFFVLWMGFTLRLYNCKYDLDYLSFQFWFIVIVLFNFFFCV